MGNLLTDFWQRLSNRRDQIFINTQAKPAYTLNPAQTLDVRKIRRIFRNRDQDYALSGHFMKPQVNSTVSFIGIPELITQDDNTRSFIEGLSIPWETVHRMNERDGDVFVWPQWNEVKKTIQFIVYPKEYITKKFYEPITKELLGFVIQEQVTYTDLNEQPQTLDIKIKITADEVRLYRSDTGVTEIKKNPFGILPIVWFSNDKEPQETEGHSEFENVEPMYKFYHDMTFEAGASQKRDGHPKANVFTNNVRQWINNNFGAGTYEAQQTGKSTVSLDSRDLFINGKDDKGFTYAGTPSNNVGAYGILSERAFTNIVEGSETSEINFGANLGTSLASVKEQRPVWIKKIERKQRELNSRWREVLDIAIMIYNFATFSTLSSDYSLEWPVPDFKDEKDTAEIFSKVISSLSQAKAAHILGDKEIHATIRKFKLVEIADDYKKHEKDIEDTVKSEQERNLDPISQGIMDELDASQNDEEQIGNEDDGEESVDNG